MMFKVLLVDDEPLARHTLRNLINWDQHGFFICGEAGSGTSALNLVKSLSPDIVILDMYMPGVNGVELSFNISQYNPKIQMIALSSFDQYDYVREALKNGAVDYLLKHRLNSGELLLTLNKCKNKISNLGKVDSLEQTHKAWVKFGELARETFIRSLLLEDKKSLENFKEDADMLNLNLSNVRTVLTIFKFFQGSDNNFAETLMSVIRIFKEYTNQLENTVITNMYDGIIVLLFSFPNMRSSSKITDAVDNHTFKIENILRTYFNIPYVCKTSRICNEIREIPTAYREELEHFSETSIISLQTNLDDYENNFTGLSLQQEKELLTCVEQFDFDGVSRILDSIFQPDKKDLQEYQIIANELIDMVLKITENHCIKFSDICTNDILINIQKKILKDKNHIIKPITEIYFNLISVIEKTSVSSKYIKRTLQYIKNNYKRCDLTLDDMANAIGITPSYLSRIFKTEMNVPLIKYINQFRIQKVIELMGTENVKIKTLYKEVGFNNYNYFFKVFKEVTGQTPMQYKKIK